MKKKQVWSLWIRHSGNVWYRTAASKQLTEKSNSISVESHAQRCHLCFGMGFPGSSAGKESACNAGDPGLIPGIGSSPGEGIGYTLQYSWISLVAQTVKNPPACGRPGFGPWVGRSPGGGAWQPIPVFLPGESPWTEEPGGLQTVASQRVRRD